METLYRKLYGLRGTVLEYGIIYLVSVVMNYLGERCKRPLFYKLLNKAPSHR